MGFFNKASRKEYRENSKEVCAISSEKDYVDIIELDIRKSADGILYCYHGNLFEYHFILKLPLRFASLQKHYHVDTLKDVLSVIDEKKSIFLDIKDTKITRGDILDDFKDTNFKEIIIGNKSVLYLDRFIDMPNNFVKILNGNIFCNFYDAQKLRKKGFKYFEAVFSFQVNTESFKKVKKGGLMFRISGLGFLTKDAYWKKIHKYNISHISSDFI